MGSGDGPVVPANPPNKAAPAPAPTRPAGAVDPDRRRLGGDAAAGGVSDHSGEHPFIW